MRPLKKDLTLRANTGAAKGRVKRSEPVKNTIRDIVVGGGRGEVFSTEIGELLTSFNGWGDLFGFFDREKITKEREKKSLFSKQC